MGYIINNTGAFVNVKLTATGREKLASGRLNFAAWAIGDSEINYNREEIVDDNPADPELSAATRILRPMDRQPNLKYFITSDGSTALNALNSNQISTIKAVVNNQAIERGFFSANTAHSNFITQLSPDYIVSSGVTSGAVFSGGTSLIVGSAVTYNVGDLILIKYTNDTLGPQNVSNNNVPIPTLWYRIQSSGTTNTVGDTVTLDRPLPNLSTTASTAFLVYHGGEIYDEFGFESTTSYWDTNTLNFASCCDVSCSDVPVWNMNNVWCENLAGMTGAGINNIAATPNESYEKFGSWEFLGQKNPYFGYKCSEDISVVNNCDVPGQSFIDPVNKSISILHYTNNTISNFYGEFFYINPATKRGLSIYLPDLMYHRRAFSSGSGTTMGMNFIATGNTQVFQSNQIQYVNLIEDPALIPSGKTPQVVGRAIPQYKLVIIDDDEIVAAMSYKSNRNWTLPPLVANLVAPATGAANGVLQPNKTMWLTYQLGNDTATGLTTTLPCQYYTVMSNNTSANKDVQFRLSDVDLLPYMRKIENAGYDGRGWYAYNFKVIWAITDGERPTSDQWMVHDFTTTSITSVAGQTIDPTLLESQNPSAVDFLLDINNTSGATTFSIINDLSMTPNSDTSILQFGDERFFYGNLGTYIGADIYKTLFRLTISADKFKFTSNPSRSSDISVAVPDIKVSECGIYDKEGELVMIGKLSRPVRLTAGATVMIEASIDF